MHKVQFLYYLWAKLCFFTFVISLGSRLRHKILPFYFLGSQDTCTKFWGRFKPGEDIKVPRETAKFQYSSSGGGGDSIIYRLPYLIISPAVDGGLVGVHVLLIFRVTWQWNFTYLTVGVNDGSEIMEVPAPDLSSDMDYLPGLGLENAPGPVYGGYNCAGGGG